MPRDAPSPGGTGQAIEVDPAGGSLDGKEATTSEGIVGHGAEAARGEELGKLHAKALDTRSAISGGDVSYPFG